MKMSDSRGCLWEKAANFIMQVLWKEKKKCALGKAWAPLDLWTLPLLGGDLDAPWSGFWPGQQAVLLAHETSLPLELDLDRDWNGLARCGVGAAVGLGYTYTTSESVKRVSRKGLSVRMDSSARLSRVLCLKSSRRSCRQSAAKRFQTAGSL